MELNREGQRCCQPVPGYLASRWHAGSTLSNSVGNRVGFNFCLLNTIRQTRDCSPSSGNWPCGWPTEPGSEAWKLLNLWILLVTI